MTATGRADRARRSLRPVTPVSIAAERALELAASLQSLDGVPEEVTASAAGLAALLGGLDAYVEDQTTPESAALRSLSASSNEREWDRYDSGKRAPLEAEMLSGGVEGQLLKMLVHLTRARRVLEIGTFTGYAALAMAEAMRDDGSVLTCEIDPEVARLAREAFAASDAGTRIEIAVGPAVDTLADLAAEGAVFELIFIDADKAGYAGYVQTVLDAGLLHPDGVLCIDNTLMQGEPWTGVRTVNGRAIADFNEALAADDRVEQVLVPVRDGLTLVRLSGGPGGAQ